MNRFNERHADLIYHLFHANTWCSLGYLSEKTNYSKSTIWRDLTFMNDDLPEGWRIERHEMKGIRLIKPENGTLECIWAHLKESNSYIKILGLIIFQNGVSITEIIDEVHISRSTVYRQINKIKEVLETAGVCLTKSPFRLKGDEKKIRRFIMQFLEFTDRILYFSDVDTFEIEKFKTSLLQETAQFSISLHMGALHRLATVMYISNLRISQGCYVSYPKHVLEEYKESEFFDVSKNLFRYMKKCPTRDIQLNEILFFALYLINEKIPVNRSADLKNVRTSLKLKSDERARLLFRLLSQLSDYVGFDISQDDSFLYKIVQTLRRIYFDFQLETDTRINTMLSFLSFMESNPLFKAIEKITNSIFPEHSYSSKPLEKVQVFEIFLLVQAAMLRKKKQTTIITALICRTYIEMEFIREILHYHFGNQLSITVLDHTDLNILKKNNTFDLVIKTTGPEIHVHHLPVLQISSFPSTAELAEIKQFIDRYFWEQLGIDPVILYPFQEG